MLNPGQRLRIVIPGGSGQVGRLLAAYFQERGHHVTVFTRGPFAAPWQTVHWDGEREGQWTEHLEGADVCINLAGRSVNCRYTRKNREAIYRSRIDTTELLGRVIASLAHPPKVWLNASTATIYRHALDRPMDEFTGEIGGHKAISGAPIDNSDPWNFSIKVATDWENAFFSAPTLGTRKIAMRTAVVMSATEGPFPIYLNLVRFSLGGTQGNGRQFISWIHELDFARAVEFLIARDDIDGIVNIASPHPLPNRDFMAALRDAYGMPNGIPAPALLLEVAAFFHRTETELLLKSRRVKPSRLLDAGFDFHFPDWTEAAEDLVRQWRNR
jgi:hypothetical protein